MSELKVKGKITKILEKLTGQKKDGSGEWVKQSFVIDNGEQYNNLTAFEVFGEEKVENLNKYNKVGDEVEVSFNISCNEWQGKYYTTLQAWIIKKVDSNIPSPAVAVAQDLSGGNDLPF
jgi:hypothetical protein